MSRAWSIGKTDRFKIDAFQKKNKMLENVAPGTYERTLTDKRLMPKWSMGAKVKTIDKRTTVSPDAYNLPSRVVETQGKSMGLKFGGALQTQGKLNVPGPGAYNQEK